ncbi:hypothetical protein [Arthrobacter sp. IK3]|uniref:hypothetical protein n=1 Tax=Arthrobacter sp. IK3 TaxID=3448169 RepID=UPI003EE056C9
MQRNPFAGYAVHPGTGYLIEPGTNNLIDANTGLYTDLRWDPATNTVIDALGSAEETDAPEPTPEVANKEDKKERQPTESAASAAVKKPTPAPTAEQAVAATDRVSADSGTNWSTHWLTRSAVFLALAGAGVAYYLKLQKGSPRTAQGKN